MDRVRARVCTGLKVGSKFGLKAMSLYEVAVASLTTMQRVGLEQESMRNVLGSFTIVPVIVVESQITRPLAELVARTLVGCAGWKSNMNASRMGLDAGSVASKVMTDITPEDIETFRKRTKGIDCMT